jgi:hypothetical protein
VTESESLPGLRIQPRVEYLHAVGPSAALAYFAELAREFTGVLRLKASRLDLFADFQGWALEAEDRHCFVNRADDRVTHEKSEVFTGFEFGRRKGKTVMARIYDKTLDARRKGADWWPERWGALFDPTCPVWRIEYEFGRVGLQQFSVDTPADALVLAPSLRAYATGKWLSHRTPTDDETRSRWPISIQWAQVQQATLSEGALDLDRIRQGVVAGSLRKMMPGIVGYMSSAAALLGADTWKRRQNS